ncbi:MAG: serine/threonine-protein kinase [Thermoguttaceae bacterium]|nr:serine/threonine-protein kinase [Thermoguttaceae bacterium]
MVERSTNHCRWIINTGMEAGLRMRLLSVVRSLLSSKKLQVTERFELVRELGSGTMSRFYKVRERKTGTLYGLKVMDAAKTAAFEAKFIGLDKPSEGQIASQMNHPHIIQTLEYGVTSEDSPFALMEFFNGLGLNQMLLRHDEVLRRFDVQISIIRQMASAIAYIHECGFLHRDICARNLLVSSDGLATKLIDFGLAVPMTPPFMQPGNRTGTLNYMAPELIRRSVTDQRVDVFAFGVTCYELLSDGVLPWEAATSQQAAMQRCSTLPVPILERTPLLDPRLATAVEWCIAPERERRCPDLNTFLKKITAIRAA